MQVQDALAKYVVQLEADGRSPYTIAQYRRHVRLLGRWVAGREVEEIDHEDLAAFLRSPAARCRPDGREKKATAQNALRSSLRCFFGYLHGAGIIRTNPARLIRRARCGGPRPRCLSRGEEGRLLAVLQDAPERDRVLFTLMLRTGLRLGSALGLDVEDVDLEARELRLRHAKGNREEIACLPTSLVDPLRAWIGDRASGPLFIGVSLRRITRRHASRRFQGLLQAAGITRVAGTHTLRHTLGTRLYERTGDIELVRAALHHRSIASTMVYARCGLDDVRAALG